MKNVYQEKIDGEVQMLFDVMRKRVSLHDFDRIKDAYDFSAKAHSGQFRKGGEPYIIHPVEVALIVATELELGANPVIAAFLHDVVEDTDYTIEDIVERYGEDVGFLVESVTKKKNEKKLNQVDNFRKILSSANYDVRAVLLKLADRLNNMRTLNAMLPHKQMKIAGETGYFFAPFANRLGMYHIKGELENLSFRYRSPREYNCIKEQLEAEKERNNPKIDAFVTKVKDCLANAGLNVTIEVRYRNEFSLWRKMKEKGTDFKHVEGKHYIRIIYPDYAIVNDVRLSEKEMAIRIYSVLTDNFKELPGSVMNYINAPKRNGYQSFHVKLLCEQEVGAEVCANQWEEIHISSERMVRKSRLGCVAERTESNVNSWVEKFRGMLTEISEVTDEADFLEVVDLGFPNDDILVFTPDGQGVILPKNASALDFAFYIHTNIGLKAKYARINGKLSSIKTMLNRGDCVEIGTSDDVHPEPDWLNYVKLYKAKKELRHYLQNKPKVEHARCEHCHPLPGDEVIAFKNGDGSLMMHKSDCAKALARASREGDAIVAQSFDEHKDIVYPVRISVKAIDRYHLLSELLSCITDELHLPVARLATETMDNIGTCTIDFSVHSVDELNQAVDSINMIDGVEEVSRIDVE